MSDTCTHLRHVRYVSGDYVMSWICADCGEDIPKPAYLLTSDEAHDENRRER